MFVHHVRPRRIAARALIPAAVAAVVLATAGAASAHVTVDASSTLQGSYSRLTFHVPNERDDANTVRLEIALPADAPLASVSVKPTPGWTATIEKTELATPLVTGHGQVTEVASRVIWTGGQVKPGEYQDFSLSVGPLPADTTTMVFKALQTYSSGEVVRWIEEKGPDGTTPAHPAPVLTLVPAAATTDAHATTAATEAATTAPSEMTVSATTASGQRADATARILGGVAVALAVIALGVAVTGTLRRRRS